MNYYVDTCIWLNIFNSDEANTKQSKCSKNLIIAQTPETTLERINFS